MIRERAFVYFVPMSHLSSKGLEDLNVRKHDHPKGGQNSRVGEHEAIDIVAYQEVNTGEWYRDEPNGNRDEDCSKGVCSCSVFQWCGDRGVAVHSECRQAQERGGTGNKESHISSVKQFACWLGSPNAFNNVTEHRKRIGTHANKKISQRQVEDKAVERSPKILVWINDNREENQRIPQGGYQAENCR